MGENENSAGNDAYERVRQSIQDGIRCERIFKDSALKGVGEDVGS